MTRMALALTLALLTAQTMTSPALAQQAADGERLFRTRCGTCHSVEPGQNRVGPSLAGVLGRTAGTLEGARYSPALRESGIVWSSETIDAYLANPRQLVPGTTMTIGLRAPAERAAVIAYLDGRGDAP
ncbi:MAG TPA: c-type cytochrome [Geminicoccus sp.]|uniref:c-type cytochrome n=1 Tax=Geminicoccus sp. TaxID=2024832 RepID=UPI002C9E531F|nr:c-type cytochrome [Geminicoccus sp.]HWL68164.1 c-type cytochrome [Geminicoccus sp.]